MALGKPVIATGYSGNLDFMTPANSYLVDFALTSVGPDGENYPAEGTWAEPDLDHAAALMRQVWEQRDEARAKGDRAAHDVAEALSPGAVGRQLRARLELLSVRDAHSAPESRPPDFDELERNLAFASEGSLYARHRGLARFLRRLVLRLMRPFTHYQSQLDHAIVEQLKRISAELSDDRAARADDLARLQRLEKRVEAAKRRDADGRTGKQEAAEAISPVDGPSTSL
jgi:hypothetical protein